MNTHTSHDFGCKECSCTDAMSVKFDGEKTPLTANCALDH